MKRAINNHNENVINEAEINATKMESSAKVDGRWSTTTFTASFKPITYKISFDKNGTNVTGTSPSDIEATYDKEEVLPNHNTLAWSGHSFLGWSTSSTTTVAEYLANQNVMNLTNTQDTKVTLYAVWAETDCIVINYLSANEVMGSVSPSREAVVINDKANGSTANANYGYHFEKWTDKNNTTVSLSATLPAITSITEAATYTAHFVENDKVTITYTTDGTDGASVTKQSESLSPVSDTATGSTAITPEGYHFVGWSHEVGGKKILVSLEETFVPEKVNGLNKEDTYTANFKANSYSIVFDANGGTGSLANEEMTYGTSKALTNNIFTREHYSFTGWNTKADGTGQGYANGDVVNNLSSQRDDLVTLYAQWEGDSYKITYDKNNSEAQGEMDAQTIAYGQQQTLKTNVFTYKGHTFLGWSTNKDAVVATYSNEQSVMDAGNTTLYAIWTESEQVIVSYVPNDEAIGNTIPRAELVSSGDKPLGSTAIEKAGYHFDNWTDGQGNIIGNEVTYQPTSAVEIATTYTANFSANTYDIVFDKNSDEAFGTMSQQTMLYGTLKVLNACTFDRDGYSFAGWNTLPNGMGHEYTDEEEVKNLSEENKSSVTLYAQWKAQERSFTIEYYTSLIGNEYEKEEGYPSQGIGSVGDNVNLEKYMHNVYGYSIVSINYQANGIDTTQDELAIQKDNSLLIRIY